MMETIITIEHPFKKVPCHKWKKGLPLRWKFSWLFQWHVFSIGEFGGSRTNTRYSLSIFCRHVLTLHRNQYHDRSDAERADEYLRKWSECEKELKGYRLLVLGDSTGADVKKLIKESLGVDLDEGRIL